MSNGNTKTYDNELRGVLFKNDEKKELAAKGQDTSKWADYQGNCQIDGQKFYVSAWIKESNRDGSKFLSLAFKKADGPQGRKRNAAPAQNRAPAPNEEDDIPF